MNERRTLASQPGILLNDIPGLATAMAAAESSQYQTRENSLLNLTYDLCGFNVRTMTIRDYVLLDRVGSPFLQRVEPTMADLAMFLWILSPEFKAWINGTGLRKWLPSLQPVAAFLYSRKVNRAFGKDIPKTSEAMIVKCFEYIDEMFFDCPPSVKGGEKSCLSYLTGWFDSLQSEYHFTSEQVWEMGLPELFQRLAAIRQRINPSMPQFNKRTDELKMWIVCGIRNGKFSVSDLVEGKVSIPKFSKN